MSATRAITKMAGLEIGHRVNVFIGKSSFQGVAAAFAVQRGKPGMVRVSHEHNREGEWVGIAAPQCRVVPAFSQPAKA